jgi:hypothetical protein
VPNTLAPFNCDVAIYDFDVDTEIFDLGRFHKETGLPSGDKSWSTIFYARQKLTGYHVHFDGSAKGKEVRLSLKYYGRSVTRPRGDGPFAETAMEWLGSFFKKPKQLAWVFCRFSKPNRTWRSRFNLPFKVTMSGSAAEVVIDGISLDLPNNSFGAQHGWINKFSKELDAAVSLQRTIEFSAFKIEDEIPVYNGAVKMFVEEISEP